MTSKLHTRVVIHPSPAAGAGRGPALSRSSSFASLLAATALLASCAGSAVPGESDDEAVAAAASAVVAAPVGLAVQVENGVGIPLQLRAGQAFYLNQIDLRASTFAAVDEGLAALKTGGDFASLGWQGVAVADQDVDTLPNADGTFTRHRYYRDAKWMKDPSSLKLEQLDGQGHVVGQSVSVGAGKENKRAASDGFFVRRLRAIQWTRDCVSPVSCAGATHFEEEALVELRDALAPRSPFTLHPATTALRLTWSARAGAGYVIPVTQVAAPAYAYGFSMDVVPLTPPGANGAYAPGSDVAFQVTLRDGAGTRLHPPGLMPSYFEAELLGNPAGIQYYHAFFDPTILYYRRKHTERSMMAEISGPTDAIQPIRTVVGFPELLSPDGIQHVGLPERDGFFADIVEFPRANDLIGGAFDPSHAAWFAPVSDTWTTHIPANAAPGSYLISMKARRVYLGEDVPFTRTISIQVGTPAPTMANVPVGGCAACHQGGGALATVAHANDNLASCTACHAPLALEPNNPIYVRAHFIHSRSKGRLDRPLQKCAMCHLESASIQRTSKSACLSCHTSYPASHVAQFGPISSPFIGGGFESFAQCTAACHVTHPGSGLGGGCDDDE